MWLLTIRSPAREPYEYILEPGRNTIGRKSGNAIQILDQSASREHAEIDYDPDTNTLLIKDLGSSNGTFVNRERITAPHPLHPEDQIRIGQYVIALTVRGDETHALVSAPLPSTTQPFTRDLLLESIDQHAILLYEVAGRLNRVIDLHLALREVSELMRLAMGADRCEVILVEHLDRLPQLGFPTSLAHEVVGQHLAVHIPDISTYPNPDLIKTAALLGVRSVLCIPVMTGDQVTAIVYAYKTQAHRRPFDRRDMQLAVAISHQAALTIERTRLHDQTERRLKHVQALRAIDQAIAGSVDLRMTLNILLQHIVSQLQIDAVVVLLYNPYTNLLEYAAGQGFRTRKMERFRRRLGEGYAGQAALERRSVSIADLGQAHDFARAPLLAGENFVTYYGVPLIAKGQVKGVLEIFHRAPLNPDQEWLEFLETLAGQAAIAIDNAQLFDNLQHVNSELALAYDATIEGWSRALDLHDKEPEGHTQRVTEVTVRLARDMGLSEGELEHVRRGALLHDIGMMGVPDGIVLNPGPLTDEEWAIVRKHPEYAYQLLAPIPHLRSALDIPYGHHEKWDGAGYPNGLKGEQIPLAARVFAVVDVWDALRSDRPYRAGWPEEKVREHIESLSGTHFDPAVVEVFLRMTGEE